MATLNINLVSITFSTTVTNSYSRMLNKNDDNRSPCLNLLLMENVPMRDPFTIIEVNTSCTHY